MYIYYTRALYTHTHTHIYIYIYTYTHKHWGPLNPLLHRHNIFSPTALLPKAGYRLLIHEAYRPHAQIHHRRYRSSGRVIGPKQRTPPDNTSLIRDRHLCPSGFKPIVSVIEGQQTYGVDRAASRIGSYKHLHTSFKCYIKSTTGC